MKLVKRINILHIFATMLLLTLLGGVAIGRVTTSFWTYADLSVFILTFGFAMVLFYLANKWNEEPTK